MPVYILHILSRALYSKWVHYDNHAPPFMCLCVTVLLMSRAEVFDCLSRPEVLFARSQVTPLPTFYKYSGDLRAGTK